MNEHILIVDDDPGMTEMLAEVLRHRGFRTSRAAGGEDGMRAARELRPDVIVTDVRMGAVSGIDLLRTVKGELPETIVILMTAFGTLESAIEAVREGAYDYVSKPFKAQELLLVVERALESRRIAAENRQLKTVLREQSGITEIIGRSPKMIDVFKTIARAADSTAAVLIQGETGVGKELVARAVHTHGSRKTRPFLAINCAALSESLLESELFGHEKGAFTGAVAKKAGLFKEANGGTVFLDEIGDMPPALQAKVLRALQSGEIRPVGANESFVVDVRIVAATNRSLREAVKDGQFREDLYYRLNTLVIAVPPLRDRLDDIPLLVDQFIKAANIRTGKHVTGISKEAIAALRGYDWPGNVRELEHVIDRAVAFAREEVIVPDALPAEIFEPRQSTLESLDEMERRHILYVLRKTQGNRNRAAEILGIDRKTLYRKLLKFGIEGDEGSDGGDAGGGRTNP